MDVSTLSCNYGKRSEAQRRKRSRRVQRNEYPRISFETVEALQQQQKVFRTRAAIYTTLQDTYECVGQGKPGAAVIAPVVATGKVRYGGGSCLENSAGGVVRAPSSFKTEAAPLSAETNTVEKEQEHGKIMFVYLCVCGSYTLCCCSAARLLFKVRVLDAMLSWYEVCVYIRFGQRRIRTTTKKHGLRPLCSRLGDRASPLDSGDVAWRHTHTVSCQDESKATSRLVGPPNMSGWKRPC